MPDEAELLQRLFDEAGIRTTVTANLGRRSAEQLPWAMIVKIDIAVLAAVAGSAYVKAFADEAGRASWRGLKWLVGRVYESRRRPDRKDGSILIEEQTASRQIVLREDLPDEAYREIVENELAETGYYVWDGSRWVRH